MHISLFRLSVCLSSSRAVTTCIASLVTRQCAVAHRYTAVPETPATGPILSWPTLQHVRVLRKCKDNAICCGHDILTEGVLVTVQSGNAGVAAWRSVWVTTNLPFSLRPAVTLKLVHFAHTLCLCVVYGAHRTLLFMCCVWCTSHTPVYGMYMVHNAHSCLCDVYGAHRTLLFMWCIWCTSHTPVYVLCMVHIAHSCLCDVYGAQCILLFMCCIWCTTHTPVFCKQL